MSTRERIIETALSLFNEAGSGAISTNHIAAACHISPGNLYYHFRNKEAIIRAIFAQMVQVGSEENQAIQAGREAMTALFETFVMVQRFNWRYRFFKRELTVLLHNDATLAAEFIVVHRSHQALVRATIARFIAEGFIEPLSEVERELFVEQLWLIILFWLNYLEVGGETVDDATLARGNAVLFNAIEPRLTAAARALLAAGDLRQSH